MKPLNDITKLQEFIAVKNGYKPKQPKVKKDVWEVYYLGKPQYKGSYAQCVAFKNQFKGQKDYTQYIIK